MTSAPVWDIFCQVIDNHGDLGVCWRLARQLAGRGQRVRLWVDDARALRWMAPDGYPGVQVRPWAQSLDLSDLGPGDVLIEAFACEVPPDFLEHYRQWRQADGRPAAWINLEYLSAEKYVERSHGLPSPVMTGPGRGLSKHFFYPGFTPGTGGLLREDDLLSRQKQFDASAWLAQRGLPVPAGKRLVSLFCYEPAALPELLAQLGATEAPPTRLLVTAGRASAAVQACTRPGKLEVTLLPYLSQDDYDHLLWACDLNFVRGEDSLVRALWAEKPFVWQIYPQGDAAHHAKLESFLDLIAAPDSWRQFHRVWNGLSTQALLAPDLKDWSPAASRARERLLSQTDLLSRLLDFVAVLPRPGPAA